MFVFRPDVDFFHPEACSAEGFTLLYRNECDGQSIPIQPPDRIVHRPVGTMLSAHWAMANDLSTSGREAEHIGRVTMATIGGAVFAKALGPGVDLLNRLSSDTGYQALLVGCAVLYIVGALILMPVKVEVSETGPSEEAR